MDSFSFIENCSNETLLNIQIDTFEWNSNNS